MRDVLTAALYPGVYRRKDGRFVVRVKAVSDRTGKPVERKVMLPEDATLAEARLVADAGGEDTWMFPAGGRALDSGRCITTTALWVWLQTAPRELNLPALSGKTCHQPHISLSDLAGITQAITMAQVGHDSPTVHAVSNRPHKQPRQDAAPKLGAFIRLGDHGQKLGRKWAQCWRAWKEINTINRLKR
jgi:hypothetical protein